MKKEENKTINNINRSDKIRLCISIYIAGFVATASLRERDRERKEIKGTNLSMLEIVQ